MSTQRLVAPMSSAALAAQQGKAAKAAIPILTERVISGNLTYEQITTIAYIFPLWQVGEAVVINDIRVYLSTVYRCVQAHTTQADWTPNITPALWTPYRDPNAITDWVQPLGAQDAYPKGAKVRHNGYVWTSDVDNNVWEPGVSQWTQVP